MDQGLIPSRYAKALYKFAVDAGVDSGIYAVMQSLADAAERNPELERILANPFVSDADKMELLTTAAVVPATRPETAVAFADFLKLLSHNKRLSFARQTALAYIGLYRKANRISRVELVMASEPDSSTVDRIKALVARQLDGGTMEFSIRIQPDLIGGFIINIDNEQLDASVSNSLKQLQLQLLN